MNLLKYLTISDEDQKVGLNVIHGGYNIIAAGDAYPFSAHPSAYLFQWRYGRILQEFQLIYIINGGGVFESRSTGKLEITPGTVLLLFPNEWHRYKPHKDTGWHEYWFGFKGSIAESWVANGLIDRNSPLFHIGFNEQVFQLYQELITLIKLEPPLYQFMASGILMQTIGKVLSLTKEQRFAGLRIENLMSQAKLLLMEDLSRPLKLEEIAEQLNMSYSRFRKIFKEYTGIAPGQYQMQYRIIKAREMLSQPSIPIKQIAFELGFDSDHHFSRIFKAKTGMPPGAYRKKAIGPSA